jgi:hypothetical protein
MNGLPVLDALAEARIAEAMAAGGFENLPGAGRPLALDDDGLVAPEVRGIYRVLKNAGFVPPEVEMRREIASLQALIAALADDVARKRALARLALLEFKLEAPGARRMRSDRAYYGRLLDRFSRS